MVANTQRKITINIKSGFSITTLYPNKVSD